MTPTEFRNLPGQPERRSALVDAIRLRLDELSIENREPDGYEADHLKLAVEGLASRNLVEGFDQLQLCLVEVEHRFGDLVNYPRDADSMTVNALQKALRMAAVPKSDDD